MQRSHFRRPAPLGLASTFALLLVLNGCSDPEPTADPPAPALSLSPTSITFEVDESRNVIVSVTPSDAAVAWPPASATDVVTWVASEEGRRLALTAVRAGTDTLSATHADDPTITATLDVRVLTPSPSDDPAPEPDPEPEPTPDAPSDPDEGDTAPDVNQVLAQIPDLATELPASLDGGAGSQALAPLGLGPAATVSATGTIVTADDLPGIRSESWSRLRERSQVPQPYIQLVGAFRDLANAGTLVPGEIVDVGPLTFTSPVGTLPIDGGKLRLEATGENTFTMHWRLAFPRNPEDPDAGTDPLYTKWTFDVVDGEWTNELVVRIQTPMNDVAFWARNDTAAGELLVVESSTDLIRTDAGLQPLAYERLMASHATDTETTIYSRQAAETPSGTDEWLVLGWGDDANGGLADVSTWLGETYLYRDYYAQGGELLKQQYGYVQTIAELDALYGWVENDPGFFDATTYCPNVTTAPDPDLYVLRAADVSANDVVWIACDVSPVDGQVGSFTTTTSASDVATGVAPWTYGAYAKVGGAWGPGAVLFDVDAVTPAATVSFPDSVPLYPIDVIALTPFDTVPAPAPVYGTNFALQNRYPLKHVLPTNEEVWRANLPCDEVGCADPSATDAPVYYLEASSSTDAGYGTFTRSEDRELSVRNETYFAYDAQTDTLTETVAPFLWTSSEQMPAPYEAPNGAAEATVDGGLSAAHASATDAEFTIETYADRLEDLANDPAFDDLMD